MSLLFLTFALLTSLGALRSIFEPTEDTIERIRDTNPWTLRAMQILGLASLLVVQSILFGHLGSASFSGLSLLLYLVIIWETAWIALLWNPSTLDFLSENPAVAFGAKILSLGQALLTITLIVGWFGIGPATSEFITGATAQKVLTQNAPELKSFTGHWRKVLKTDAGETEKLVDAHVNGKDFVVVTKIGVIQNTEIYLSGKLTEIMNLIGTDQREVSSSESIPTMMRHKMIWMATDGLRKAADQSNPPVSRPATLFTGDESSGYPAVKEWVDRETGIVLYRKESVGEFTDTLELLSLETTPIQDSVFNPDLY